MCSLVTPGSIPQTIKAAIADSEFRLYPKNAADGESAELLIMDDIGEDYFGDGITAKEVVNFLGDNKGRRIDVRINSFGGSVYDGLVITNNLMTHDADVTTTVEGIAYSAASIIAMAGQTRRMHEMSDLGLHRAQVGAIGNQNIMRSVVDWLGALDEKMVTMFGQITGENADQVNAWLDGKDSGVFGTVFTATEAMDAGFITEVIPIANRNEDAEAFMNTFNNCHQRVARSKITASLKASMDVQAAVARRRQLTS